MGQQVLGNQVTPPIPVAGTTTIFVDIADKHTKQRDDTGTIIDLTAGGGAQTDSIYRHFLFH